MDGDTKPPLQWKKNLLPSVEGQPGPARGAGGGSASGRVQAGMSWGLQESSFRYGSHARGLTLPVA